MVENTIPVLSVRDLPKSIRYYTETLEFELDWAGDSIGSVSKDGHPIMLREAERVSASWIWIGLENDSLFDAYRSKGVKVAQEPRNHDWAYEMKFQDLDGNVLWLGTEPKKDLPLAEGG